MTPTPSFHPIDPTGLGRAGPPLPAPVPLPPPAPWSAGPAATPARARRPRRTALIVVVAALAALTLFGGMLLGLDRVLTHDLAAADFDAGADGFYVGENTDYRLGVVDGAYRITAMPSIADGTAPAVSFVPFARTAFTADVEATVVAAVDPTGGAGIGIACYDLPRTNGNGYELRLASGHIRLVRHEAGSETVLTDVATSTAWPPTATRLRLSCYVYDNERVELHGYVDGVETIRASEAAGFTQYQHVALVFRGPVGSWASFDDVSATVPE